MGRCAAVLGAARARKGAPPPPLAAARSSASDVGIPGVRAVSRPAAAVKALLAGKDDEEPGDGFGRNVSTLDRDIAHLTDVFPGA